VQTLQRRDCCPRALTIVDLLLLLLLLPVQSSAGHLFCQEKA
jgi:hypothetical protein